MNKRWLWISAMVLLVAGMAFAACESMGWPFLTGSLQNQIQLRTGHTLRLQAPGDKGVAPPPRTALLGRHPPAKPVA